MHHLTTNRKNRIKSSTKFDVFGSSLTRANPFQFARGEIILRQHNVDNTFPPRNRCAWHGLIALDSLLHPIPMVLYYSKSYSAFDSFQSNAQGGGASQD
ncbi:hypothetical protein PROFUN_04279 [Planoprotostelium fungivorum]|uniref:Uncharacterized protein n=1 Tax=Planoprotostelium fungivorum TaxID=1890364 RepID=A0A2P6NV23_9EUKA|nr:hypothetical protein PROFUN_04279 [Planoprotostelium fungivorum]